jgi:hypothetical protein
VQLATFHPGYIFAEGGARPPSPHLSPGTVSRAPRAAAWFGQTGQIGRTGLTCDGARAGEPADDWTNRAPFPTLHLLREARVEVAAPSPYTCLSPCFDAPALQRHRLGFLRLLSVGILSLIRVLPELAHLSQEALEGFTEPEEVWQRNVRVMREKGVGFMRALVAGCLRG